VVAPGVVDQTGRVLGGRYRLVARIGSGSSAEVWQAEDVALGRSVAVKVLLPALARDPGFVRRLEAEAHAAALLTHPHIARVYDWGDADEAYLVMELLGGGSLRSLLDAGSRLSPLQAARLVAEAASGLAYAHRRGIVHRDVKPANLLFDDEGRVVVADFGLARALAEAGWTEPDGRVLGTARYASPEQAVGKPAGERSDVYSLALVAVEAVTGSAPFGAETTLGTLMARTNGPIPVPEELGVLRPILWRAGALEPERRLDAEELASACARVVREQPPAEPIELHPLVGLAPVDRDPTELGGQVVPASESRRARRRAKRAGASGRTRRRWPWVLSAVVVTLLVAAGGAAYWAHRYFGVGIPTERVAAVQDKSLGTAERALAAEKLRAVVGGSRYDKSVPKGWVIEQSPLPGAVLRERSVVTLVVSKGPAPVAVPTLAGKTEEQAVATLSGLGLQASVSKAYDGAVPAGEVVAQKPTSAAGPVPYGSTVAVTISLGPHPRTVPSLVGQAWASAEAALQHLALVPKEVVVYDDSVQAGLVISTSPGAGASVAKGSSVTVTVSEGPHLTKVPAVAGESVAQATATLQAAGLGVANVFGPPTTTVFVTSPQAGTTVDYGSSVSLYTLPG